MGPRICSNQLLPCGTLITTHQYRVEPPSRGSLHLSVQTQPPLCGGCSPWPWTDIYQIGTQCSILSCLATLTVAKQDKTDKFYQFTGGHLPIPFRASSEQQGATKDIKKQDHSPSTVFRSILVEMILALLLHGHTGNVPMRTTSDRLRRSVVAPFARNRGIE